MLNIPRTVNARGRSVRRWIAIPLAVAFLATTTCTYEQIAICTGPFAGKRPTEPQLAEVLANHQDWIAEIVGNHSDWKTRFLLDLKRTANFCGADLRGKDLQGVDLRKALLGGANLSGVDLRGANLTGAYLETANLAGANLERADLSNANLFYADLSGAFLDLAKWPEPIGLIGTKGLSEILFYNVKPIVDARKELKVAGFRNEARALSSALKKLQLEVRPPGEKLFEGLVLGGLLTDFGADPLGAITWLPVGVLVFFWLYLLAIFIGNEKAGLWRDRPKDRLLKLPEEKDHELIVFNFKWLSTFTGVFSIVGIPLYFSILSAFHFGWRQLNIGNWLVRLQLREYTFRATGWVRTVAGIQSLISLYLVALALLTYFGDPFG